MRPVQDVIVITKNGGQLAFHIYPDSNGKTFSANVLHREPNSALEDASVFAVAVAANGAEEAFGECMRYVVNLCEYRNDEVLSINNPCNCEFVSLGQQQALVNRRIPTIQVTVNA
jgi:hypothetical protein